jgi:flavin reductase (DIM6/NTAB) family NADH-FMN oxidoreductase RutF/DNA-binding IclR family transcriptional regulator
VAQATYSQIRTHILNLIWGGPVTETPLAARDFRRALGQYPTGVAVITARQDDGTPVGMVVGTFTSVSLDPPLVGFLPDRTSTTWPLIRAAGRFCVNVLGAGQEHVCRAFVTKADDRFDVHGAGDTAGGSPRLAGTVLWIDCDVDAVLPAGDHDMVLGRVRDLGVPEDAGLPMLFVRGGYGSPQLPSIQTERPEFADQLRLADLVRPEAEAVSRDLGLECLVSAAVGNSVVSLAAAGIGTAPGGSDTRVGTAFPLAAPIAPLFVAWAGTVEQMAWLDRGRRLTGTTDPALAMAELEAVRSLGYQVTTGQQDAELFERSVVDHDRPDGVAEVLRRMQERAPEPRLHTPFDQLTEVTSLAAPVRDRDGRVVLALHLMGFSGTESPDRLHACLDRLLAGAARAGELLNA